MFLFKYLFFNIMTIYMATVGEMLNVNVGEVKKRVSDFTIYLPLFIISYFFMNALVDGSFLNLIAYLFSLIITMLVVLGLKVKAPLNEDTTCTSGFPEIFPSFKDLLNRKGAPSVRLTFYTFTLIYMLMGVISNPVNNTRGIMFIILLLLITALDYNQHGPNSNYNMCYTKSILVYSIFTGGLLAWLCWWAIVMLGGKHVLYFTDSYKKGEQCRLNKKKVRFKCKVNKY